MSEVLWYYEEGGKQAGPISQVAMAEAIRGGRLPPGSRVWRAGMTGWLAWEAVAELAALAPPPPVGGPPAPSAPPPAPPGAGAPAPGWGAPQPGGPPSGWGPPPSGTAPFPPNSYAAEALQSAAPYPKAPLGARFVAYLLDSLISGVPIGLAAVGLAVGVGEESTPATVVFGVVLAAAVAWGVWYAFTKDGRPNGQSIGKKAMGLMVVHLPTNQPCTRGQSALRALVMAAFGLVPYVGGLVEPIVTLVADGGRRLGDKAAATQVVAVGDWRRR